MVGKKTKHQSIHHFVLWFEYSRGLVQALMQLPGNCSRFNNVVAEESAIVFQVNSPLLVSVCSPAGCLCACLCVAGSSVCRLAEAVVH